MKRLASPLQVDDGREYCGWQTDMQRPINYLPSILLECITKGVNLKINDTLKSLLLFLKLLD